MSDLFIRNVALDTQFVISQNYLKGSLISELGRQAAMGHINLFLTDIVAREILKNFREALIAAKSKNINRQYEKLYILKHFKEYESYFCLPEIEVDELTKQFSAQFDLWLVENNIIMIPTNEVVIGAVFNNYFQKLPPFEEGKKYEFPDAFNLEALIHYFNKKSEKCILLTADTGVKQFQHELLVMEKKPGDLIGEIVKEFGHTEIPYLERKFQLNLPDILKLTEEPASHQAKNAIFNRYTIDDRLIDRIDFFKIDIKYANSFDIIHATTGNFEILFVVDIKITTEISFLSSTLSKWGEENATYNLLNEPRWARMNASERVDVLAKGEYNIAAEKFEIREISVSPMQLAFPSFFYHD